MKKASRYVTPDTETDFYTLTEIAKKRNEIVVGYKKTLPDGMIVKTNPLKSECITFSKEDYLVVIAEDNN